MTQHIGIVACSAEGAALCYRTICVEGAQHLGPHAHPEVSMHTHSLADYMTHVYRGEFKHAADLMLASAHKLAKIGADFLICPDNTMHRALGYVVPKSPLPWLHIADVVIDEALARKYQRVGLLGTRWLMDSQVYPERFQERGLTYVRPFPAERDEVNRIIMDELVYGMFKPESVAYLNGLIGNMKEQMCHGVILACTELPLVIDDANSPLPTLDSTRLLARAALNRAIGTGAGTERRSGA